MLKRFCFKLCVLGMMSFLVGCGASSSSHDDAETETENKALSGGSHTVFDFSNEAFGHMSPEISSAERSKFFVGKVFFDQNWVTSPSSVDDADGLGPFFNARSCLQCHAQDGRGKPPESGQPFVDLLIRLSVPGQDAHGGPLPDPNYGEQLQGFSIQGVAPEGTAVVTYAELSGTYPDSTVYSLLSPSYQITNLAYGALDSAVMMSPRIAPAMIGLGLLEAISEADILANEDESDSNSDGISGRANWVWDVEKNMLALGRFGWKANQPNVRQQISGAFLGDIGLTSPLFINPNITNTQLEATNGFPNGGSPEVSELIIDRVAFYSSKLAVPARRNVDDPTNLRGEMLFKQIQCAACHLPTMQSGGETIRPYTDLLLHDMGEGLADNRPDFRASGREWRTPPLWGIGLVETVNGHTRFLHDGRARNLEEAILWHGGEAEASKQNFKQLTKTDRDAILAFLESL